MRKNILQHIGAIVSGRRNEEHLTQQQLAQQTGRGLRHIQNIEKGRVNASIEVLADVILDLCQYFGHKKLKVYADFL